MRSARVGAARQGAFTWSTAHLDLMVFGGFALLAVLTELALVAPLVPGAPSAGVIVVWATAFMAPLAVRSRWPVAVMVVMTGHFLLYWAAAKENDIAGWLALGAGVYSAAAYGRRPLAGRAVLACLFGFAGVILAQALVEAQLSVIQALAVVMFGSIPFVVGWSLGSTVRTLRTYRADLEDRNLELAAQREANARRAVLEERVRIARELHDVVAHHVTVMTVQAAAARRSFGRRPDDAMTAVAAIEVTGRDAIAELKQLVGVLRSSDELMGLAPQPGLSQLPALATHMEQAGLAVALTMAGEPWELPAGVELSAYRIVQEALTNVLRHSEAKAASVTVTRLPGGIDVNVVDDGPAAVHALDGSSTTGSQVAGGKGLLGLRERVMLYGGEFSAGPETGGRFRVHAYLQAGAGG